MKRNINLWANGEFPYKKPSMDTLDKSLILEVEQNSYLEHVIDINTEGDFIVEGIVKSEHPLILIENNRLKGNVLNIQLRAIAKDFHIDDIISGRLHLITSVGEFFIGVVVKIIPKKVIYKDNLIKDIKDLSILSKEDSYAAYGIFSSVDFSSLINISNKKAMSMYNAYRYGRINQSTMNDFFTYLGFKDRGRLSLSENSIKIDIREEEDRELDILINRSKGFDEEINIFADSNAVVLSKNVIESRDFIYDSCIFKYSIISNRLTSKSGTINILFKQGLSSLNYAIHYNYNRIDSLDRKKNHNKKDLIIKLYNLYLDFRFNQIDKNTWANESYNIITKIERLEESGFLSLYKIHLMIAKEELELAKNKIQEYNIEYEKDINLKAYYLYLMAFIRCNSEFNEGLIADLNKYRQQNPDSFYILWFLLFLSDEYVNNTHLRYKAIKEQYQLSGNNVLLLCEAAIILKKNPELITSLTSLEISACRLLIKRNLMTNSLWNAIFYIANKQSRFNNSAYYLLKYGWDILKTDVSLDALCAYCINGNRRGDEFLDIYERVISYDRIIVGLFEYYIKAVPMNYDRKMPRQVIIYFKYGKNISSDEKAKLFENVVKYYSDDDMFEEYKSEIIKFTMDGLKNKILNPSMIYLYNEVLNINLVNAQNVHDIAELISYRIVRLKNSDGQDRISNLIFSDCRLKDVLVLSKDEDNYIPYSKDYTTIGVLSKDGYVYFDTKLVELEPVIYNEELKKICGKYDIHESFIYSLNKNQYVDLCFSDKLSDDYSVLVNKKTCDYYFNNPFSSDIDDFITRIDVRTLDYLSRNKLAALLIFYNHKYRAYEILLSTGFNKLLSDELLPLFLNLEQDWDTNKINKEFIISLGLYLIELGVRDTGLLKFLTTKVEDHLELMLKIFLACKKIGENTSVLEENIINICCLTSQVVDESMLVYSNYMKGSINKNLALGYLSLMAYDKIFLNNDRDFHDSLLDAIVSYYVSFKKLSGVCKLFAFEKLLDKKELNNDEFILLTKIADELREKGVNSFDLTRYQKKLNIDYIKEKRTIVYLDEPKRNFYIRYRLEGLDNRSGSDEGRLSLREIYPGYYITNMVIFPKETLHYSVIKYEPYDKKELECKTDKLSPEYDDSMEENLNDRCSVLNSIIVGNEEDKNFLLKKMCILDHVIEESYNLR